MDVRSVLLKIAVIFAFVASTLSLIVGMNFFMLTSEGLRATCHWVQTYIPIPLPCTDISDPGQEPVVNLLGFLMVLTAIYALYFISHRYKNL